MGKKRNRQAPINGNSKSVLLGNGIDINFGGSAYSNDFIIKRIIFNARANKYAPLFNNSISGDEIANFFHELALWTNKIANGEYDKLIEDVEKPILASFKQRYNWTVKHSHEVGLEDWFFILHVFFMDQTDLTPLWQPSKQGIERMILDSIYNDGKVQEIYRVMGTKVKRFLCEFENMFTLNYDNNIEKLTNRPVYHLHGDFMTLANSENPDTLQGYQRTKAGESVVIEGFEHCFCNALFDYSGENKYKIPNAFEKVEQLFKEHNKLEFPNLLPEPLGQWVQEHHDHPELNFGTQYHFDKFKNLAGELHIIGLSPNNDSHIFRLIDESSVSNIIFYYFSDTDKKLSTSKKVEFRKVQDLWASLGATPKKYNPKYSIPDNPETEKFLEILNCLSADPVPKDTLIREVNSIINFRAIELCKMAHEVIKAEKAKGNPKDEADLKRQFREVSRIALREGVLPSALYMHYIMNFEK